jgi:signal transduction histidine kinase
MGLPGAPATIALSMNTPNKNHRSLLMTQVACLAVASWLSFLGTTWWAALLYSLLIGNLISGLLHLGRHGLSRWLLSRPGPHPMDLREGWPGWAWMTPVMLSSGLIGYVGGLWLGDQFTGATSALPWQGQNSWRSWTGILVMSLLVTVAGTAYFYFRNRLSATEARLAQTARLAAETQLRLLESQLEPHMLFNTLANLRVLIGIDPPRAQAMLDSIIDFLRATLTASRVSHHSLADEFARLADYLALMQIRMGDRLQVALELPDELRTCMVPPLLLQPLVENAIKHGLEPSRRGGWLRVSARREPDGRLGLQVSDSGQGLPVAAAVPSGLGPESRTGTGFGLSQVRERLSTLYGAQAQLLLSPQAGGGTQAWVRLPLQTQPAPN